MMERTKSDVSAILRPGVYVLRRNGHVVWVGRGRNVLARIYAHANVRRGDKVPSWLPAKPLVFDEVEVIPCHIDDLDAAYASMCAEVGWEDRTPRSQPATDWPKVLANV